MQERKPNPLTIINVVAALIALCLIGAWVERVFWANAPRLLGISSASLGLLVMLAWLAWQGYQKFWKPRNDPPDLASLREGRRDSDEGL